MVSCKLRYGIADSKPLLHLPIVHSGFLLT